MKIALQATLQILAKCEPTKSKDGQSTYYKLTVMQGTEAGQINCPVEVYTTVREGEKAVCNMEYNSEYKSLRLIGVSSTTKDTANSPIKESK